MEKHVKRSVIPIYLVGVTWLIYSQAAPPHLSGNFLICGIISLVVFVVAKAIFPDRTFEIPGGEEAPAAKAQAEPKAEPKPASTGNAEIDALIQERTRALSEMRRLNDNIADEKISAQIDHLEEVTRKIMDQVVAQPKKLPQIRHFLNYYLPTTLKLLNAYDRMDSAGIAGDNITATKARVEGMMDTISLAFDKQLDALFGEEALDISTDITVMEQMMAREGLGGVTFQNPDGGTKLEL